MCEYIHDVHLRDRGRQLARAFMLVSQVEKDDTFEMANLKGSGPNEMTCPQKSGKTFGGISKSARFFQVSARRDFIPAVP